MLREAKAIYLATRKKHDQLFNTYFMRPLAGLVVALAARTPVTPNQLTLVSVTWFAVAAVILVAVPSVEGGWLGAALVLLSYLFDCADGMLARHRKIASKQGHLFDFFTDEIKAVMLVGALAIRMWRAGGYGLDATRWPAGSEAFLLAGIGAVAVIGSATSLTNFVRRPEISGRAQAVDAYYETVAAEQGGGVKKIAENLKTFLRFLNHYPSHVWAFAALGRLDLFFWIYTAINALYLGRGWLGLVLRFGRGG